MGRGEASCCARIFRLQRREGAPRHAKPGHCRMWLCRATSMLPNSSSQHQLLGVARRSNDGVDVGSINVVDVRLACSVPDRSSHVVAGRPTGDATAAQRTSGAGADAVHATFG